MLNIYSFLATEKPWEGAEHTSLNLIFLCFNFSVGVADISSSHIKKLGCGRDTSEFGQSWCQLELLADLHFGEVQLLLRWRNSQVLGLKEVQMGFGVACFAEMHLGGKMGLQALVLVIQTRVKVVENHFLAACISHFDIRLGCFRLEVFGLTLAHGEFNFF